MVSSKRFAYIMLVAALVFVPAWGCGTEAPEPPADVEDSSADPVDIVMPTEDGSTDGEGSGTKGE